MKYDNATSTQRLPWIDSLRGLAVLLMLQQHLVAWLWGSFGLTFQQVRAGHPALLASHLTGHLAAPLFVALAGTGAFLFMEKNPSGGVTLARRGLVILAFGYLLNFAAPHWFDPASWYVLHLIGLCLALAPLLVKLAPRYLAVIALAALAISAAAQTLLSTPLALTDARMNGAGIYGGIPRLALFEGHFPVFPWLGMFCAGIWAGRVGRREKWRMIGVAGAALAAAGLALWLAYGGGHSFMIRGRWYRAFALLPGFYPPLPPFMLILAGASLLSMGAFRWIDARRPFGNANPLACLGRSSLSLLAVHIILFNEIFRLAGLYENLSDTGARLWLVGGISALTALVMLWRRVGFRWGLEWLVRKITG